jgi:cytochrome c oxidase subunit 4
MSTPTAHAEAHAGNGAHSHVSSMFELVGIFATLMALTGLTVGLASVDLGEFNLAITLLIATFKAGLVALFFMHLRHDAGFNRLAFFGSFLFVLLFVGITLTDSGQYQHNIDWQEKVLKVIEPAR